MKFGPILFSDAEEVRDFYAAVTGWQSEPFPMDGYDDYFMKSSETGVISAGVCHARGMNADLPAQWLAYIAVEDLQGDAADVPGHRRARLPQRLGHGQPEPLSQALLHNDVGAALDGVDHGRVLLQILHRQTGQMDPVPVGPWQRRPGPADLLEDLVAFGVIADRGGRRTRQQQMRPQLMGNVTADPCSTPKGSFRGSQRDTWTTSGAEGGMG